MRKLLFLILVLVMVSCSKEPKAIEYGKDACDFCRMTIVDKIHGTELVTDKGKVYVFDATECLLHFQEQNKDLNYAHQLTNSYETPSELVPLEEVTFLISENLPSPMGANITAFQTREEAKKIQSEKGGELYNLTTLKEKLGHK